MSQNSFLLYLVRQPLYDFPSHRFNLRHLPTVPVAKHGTSNSPGMISNSTPTNRFQSNNLFLQSFGPPSTTTTNSQQQKKFHPKQTKYGFDSIHNKPRQITIVKQGNEKPHKIITILLNRRTVQTYEQLLSDISEAFGYQKNRTDKVCVYLYNKLNSKNIFLIISVFFLLLCNIET